MFHIEEIFAGGPVTVGSDWVLLSTSFVSRSGLETRPKAFPIHFALFRIMCTALQSYGSKRFCLHARARRWVGR